MIFVLLWIGLSYLVAVLGRERKFGFWGTLLVSLFFTPLVGLLTVFASDARPKPPRRCIRHHHA
ncbi:MAG TPA: hypothetical protein VEK11_15505 [Thermoanaerobaculia bacterium]|jgi:hypothetical protein|nr:hypothetical protein [Thermoanaerobaculia bacterium]